MTRLPAVLCLAAALLVAIPALAEGGPAYATVFHVEGMTCALCAKAIERALRDVEGVRSVAIDRKAERVTVVADAAIATERLEQTIEAAGPYGADLVE